MDDARVNDDRLLVRKVLDGEVRAFEIFVEKYKKLVSHIVFRMVRNVEEREDICQEVFMKIYKNLNNFHFSSKLSTWVAAIAYNNCVNYLQKRKEPLFEDIISEQKQLEIQDDNNISPDQRAEATDISSLLQMEIGKLPGSYRAIITLYHLDDMSYNEIVEITGLPIGTVKNYLFRARKMLKDRLMVRYRQEDLCS